MRGTCIKIAVAALYFFVCVEFFACAYAMIDAAFIHVVINTSQRVEAVFVAFSFLWLAVKAAKVAVGILKGK